MDARSRHICATLLGASLLACASEALEPAPLAAVCGADGPVRLIALDPGQRPVPEDSIVRVGDRVLVRSDRFGPYLLRDLESGAETPLTEHKGYPFASADHLDLLVAASNISYRHQRRLVRYPLAGGEPRGLAARVTRGHLLLANGRVVSPSHIDGRWIGALVVTDPATLVELQIDDHVSAAVDLESWHAVFAADEVAYVVDDGERCGVWLARLQ